MLTYSVILFAVTAVGGLILAARVLRGQLAPWALSVIHALLGAAGLLSLGIAAFQSSGENRAMIALVLLIVAALGGFYLASLHLRREIAPNSVVILHAGLAVVGFVTLLSLVVGI